MSDVLRVLIIDEDDDDREAVRRLLCDAAELWQAEDGADGRQLAATTPLDCALVDYRLPDGRGIELCAELLELGLGVILLTGFGGEEVAIEAMRAGAHDYLNKNQLSRGALLRAIRSAATRARLRRRIRASRVELEQFADTVAHDVRAPLNRILQYARMVRDDVQTGDTTHIAEMVSAIVADAELGLSLVAEMRDYTRVDREPVRLQEVDLGLVTARVITLLEAEIEATGAAIEVAELPVVMAEVGGLTRVLHNLLANALKFRREDRPMRIVVRGDPYGDQYRITVVDNGRGLSAVDPERIFQPFQRGIDADGRRGSGLGLALCRRILTRYGGCIDAIGSDDDGATFRFTLPGPASRALSD